MTNECSLVLELLYDGRINVGEAERLILRLNRTAGFRRREFRPSGRGVAWPGFVPPHLPSCFGAQSTTVAA